jgi:hypothetical protein
VRWLAGRPHTNLVKRMLYDPARPPAEPQDRLDFPVTAEELDGLVERAACGRKAELEVLATTSSV